MVKLILLLLSIKSNASTVYCSNGDCRPQDSNTEITFTNGDSNKTVLWINTIVDSALGISVPSGDTPRNSLLFIRNQNTTKNLTIDVGSSLTNVSGGNIDLYTDIFDTLNISASGKSGSNGKNSSVVCADSFKNSSLGTTALDYWNNTRDSSLSQTACTTDDKTWMDSQFACPTGYSEQANGSVTVSRIEKKNKCAADYYENRCVKRTYNVSCKMSIMRKVCDASTYTIADHGDSFIQSPVDSTYSATDCSSLGGGYYNSGRTINQTFRVTEKDKNVYGSQSALCFGLMSSQTKPIAYWESSHIDNGVTVVDHINTATVSFNDGSVKRAFYWPIPDSMTDSRGNNIADADARFILKSWVSAGYGGKFDNLSAYESYLSSSGGIENASVRIKNCMGLDGSSLSDFDCERTPGPEITITAYLIDKYGAVSDDLIITIPQGRYTPYWYTWVGDSATFYYADPSSHSAQSTGSHGSFNTYVPPCQSDYKTSTTQWTGNSLWASNPSVNQLCTVKYTPWGWPGIIAEQNTTAIYSGGEFDHYEYSYVGEYIASVKVKRLNGSNWNSFWHTYGNYWGRYVTMTPSGLDEVSVPGWPASNEYNRSGYNHSGWGHLEVWQTNQPNGYEYW